MTKQADLATANALNSSRVNQEFLNLLKNVVLGTAAAGGAIRGGQGLVNMVRRNTNQPKKPIGPLGFALPPATEPDPEQPMTVPFGKLAEKQAGVLSGAWDTAMAPVTGVTDWLQGKNLSSMGENPLFWAGLGTAGAGGLYAGYNGVDAVMQSRRKAEIEAEENKARQEYEKSLAGLASKSSDEKLEELYQSKDAILKEAMPNLKELGSVALGAWPPLALLSGTVAYNIANSRRRSVLLAKALKQRQRQQLTDAPVFAYTPDAGPSMETGETVNAAPDQQVA